MVIVLDKELAAISMRPGDNVKPVLDKINDTYARMAAAGNMGLEYSGVRQRLQRGAADVKSGEMLLSCYTGASFNSVKADGTSIGGYVCLLEDVGMMDDGWQPEGEIVV
ncbi:hypothetical protein CLOP_g23147 [Closterium sp. NIES-67]|nr:hypothetical protein CLOP_g23147 [Closterium sp. NIES-67]